MVLQMENKEKICRGHPGIFWICQRLYAPVGIFLYLVLFFVCWSIHLNSEKVLNIVFAIFRVNLSIAVVAMTSNKTHFLSDGREVVDVSIPVFSQSLLFVKPKI